MFLKFTIPSAKSVHAFCSEKEKGESPPSLGGNSGSSGLLAIWYSRQCSPVKCGRKRPRVLRGSSPCSGAIVIVTAPYEGRHDVSWLCGFPQSRVRPLSTGMQQQRAETRADWALATLVGWGGGESQVRGTGRWDP